jgi:hypothetical protein
MEIIMNKLFYIIILMIVTGCLNSPDSNPLNTPITASPPVATGIIITGTGHEPVIWGTVTDFNLDRSRIFHMFPNPTNVEINILFTLPPISQAQDSLFLPQPQYTDNISIEIVRALSPFDEVDQSNIVTGGAFFSQAGYKVRTLKDKKSDLWRYIHWIEWDLKDEFNNFVPAGFYRVYIRADNYEIYGDILVAWSEEDLPPDFPVELTIFGNN